MTYPIRYRITSAQLDKIHSVTAQRRGDISVLHFVLRSGMAKTITFRPDEDTQRALAALTADGTPVSTAVRSALIEAARARASQVLRSEALQLAGDEDDRAEAARVLRDMETLRAW